MDLKSDIYVKDDLMEIREYIKKSGMPHFYIEELNKVLNLVSEDYSMLKKTYQHCHKKNYISSKKSPQDTSKC